MRRYAVSLFSVLTAVAFLESASCAKSSGGDEGPGSPAAADAGADADGALPFTADPPEVYVAKVKNVLVGLPPTQQEVQQVTADPTQLGNLVDQWMMLPQYSAKMLRFFELAFQQTQIATGDFENQLNAGQLPFDGNTSTAPLMLQNQQEVFARTALQLASTNTPFNEAMSTQTYMMTTAMKVFYALTDVWGQNDTLPSIVDTFQKANPSLQISVTAKTQIPQSESADPTSPNYMHWTDPGVAKAGCDPLVYPARANTLYAILVGSLPKSSSCNGASGTGQLTTADFSDWAPVTIRQPKSGETPTAFYDVAGLRTATTLVLGRPFVGFFTTPAFFANWQTNASNTMRVTLNQSLIVATNAQIDGTDMTLPSSTPGLDTTHATQAACYTCHRLLDPSRSILASTFSWYYGAPQPDVTYASQPGLFVFEGVQKPISTIYDFGAALASHPLVAPGWTQKLCYYVNSQACDTSDPEFQRLVSLFQSSKYSWNALVKALVTSPITTHAAKTQTATTIGEAVAVSRRDHLCAAWNARLGFADFCGLDAAVTPVAAGGTLKIVSGLPSDSYARGSTVPVLPNQPSLFYRAGTENVCENIATLVVDDPKPPAGIKTLSSNDPTTAIADFVAVVAGLPPGDPRATPLGNALQAHFEAAQQQQMMAGTPAAKAATAALQSTFVAACMAPSALSIGM